MSQLDDPVYQDDIGRAEQRVQSMRHGNTLGRTLWLLNEKIFWIQLAGSVIINKLKSISDRLDLILETPPATCNCDLTLVNSKLDAILNILDLDTTNGGLAASLNLEFGQRESQ